MATRDALAARLSDASRNSDYLRFVADEISRVDPKPGEDAEIEARLPALQHAEKLAQAAGEAVQLLRGDGAATDRLALAQAALERVADIDPALDALRERVAELSALADDVGGDLRSYRDGVEHDPAGLDALLGRLGELHSLTRKYGPRLADVIRTRDEALASLSGSEAGEEGMRRAQDAVDAAVEALAAAGAALDAARHEAAPRFTAALAEAVADLAMPGAHFEVAFTELPFDSYGADGPSRVEFLYAPAPGQPARALAKIASGGELSRVMLALKGVLGEADTVQTLVFDEIDAGIGGATAHAVGRRLAKLAQTHQVIVVTHLAQVAVYADAQLVVRRPIESAGTVTTVAYVELADRVAEIARMLSGNDSDAGIAHARELLEQAASSR